MKHYLNVCDTNGFEVEPYPIAVTVSRFGRERDSNEKPQSPCQNCPERKIGCHSNCDSYLFFQDELKAFKLSRAEDEMKIHQHAETIRQRDRRIRAGQRRH